MDPEITIWISFWKHIHTLESQNCWLPSVEFRQHYRRIPEVYLTTLSYGLSCFCQHPHTPIHNREEGSAEEPLKGLRAAAGDHVLLWCKAFQPLGCASALKYSVLFAVTSGSSEHIWINCYRIEQEHSNLILTMEKPHWVFLLSARD